MDSKLHITLHESHRAVFVNGKGGTNTTAEEQAKLISSYIYFTALPERSRVDAILNQPTTLMDIPDKTLQLLLSVLTEEKMVRKSERKVRLVIFCHSHGVKVVKAALKKDSISTALKTRYPLDRDVEILERNIREQIAVVGFAGISLIPDNFAKLVLNFHAVYDNMAKISHYIHLGKQDHPESYFRSPENPDEKLKIENTFGDSVRNLANISVQLTCERAEELPEPSKTLLSSLKSSYRNDHYLRSYLANPEMLKYIRASLGLPNHR